MTRYEAIKILEYPVKKWSMEWDEREDGLSYYEALDMAISALRQQETVTNRNGLNEPLTLEELRDMPCEPVYIVVGCASWWDIVSYAGMEYLYLKVEGSLPFRDYGKNWTAYRQKPEEDDRDERKENENV